MTITIRQGDAFDLDFIADNSVDLVVTSPPYFAVRAYKSEGKVIDVVGNEPSPRAYIDNLLRWMEEMKRVIKPTGSVFVVLGDKMAGSGGHNNSAIGASKDRGPGRYNQESGGIRSKSLMGLPWRFANAAVDEGWILRAEIVWSKPNGMPESVQDRVRRAHESIFHFTKEGKYYAAIDRIRTQHLTADRPGPRRSYPPGSASSMKDGEHVEILGPQAGLPLNESGALPSSVWTISTSGLQIPAEVITRLKTDKHYAAFPPEIPRRIIEGWCPERICMRCGEGRRPLVRTRLSGTMTKAPEVQIIGEHCSCYAPGAAIPPSTPALVLDPFSGAGTTALVARVLGRSAISVDISSSYTRLALWRVFASDHSLKLARKWGKSLA